MIMNLEPEAMGVFGLSIEEKFTKELRKDFKNVNNDTSKNLYKVYLAAVKQYKKIPENVVDKKLFEEFIYKNSGIDRIIIMKFIDIVRQFILEGKIDIKKINPELNKSKWQYYAFPLLGIIGLIAVSRITSNIRGIATLKRTAI